MEKFMLIFHGGEMQPAEQTPENMEASMGKWIFWIDKLAKAGKYDSGEPLLPGGKMISGANKTITDAPFIEGKEIVGGYFIINAADYKEAVELCADYPDYDRGGKVQVRQVIKMDMPS